MLCAADSSFHCIKLSILLISGLICLAMAFLMFSSGSTACVCLCVCRSHMHVLQYNVRMYLSCWTLLGASSCRYTYKHTKAHNNRFIQFNIKLKEFELFIYIFFIYITCSLKIISLLIAIIKTKFYFSVSICFTLKKYIDQFEYLIRFIFMENLIMCLSKGSGDLKDIKGINATVPFLKDVL